MVGGEVKRPGSAQHLKAMKISCLCFSLMYSQLFKNWIIKFWFCHFYHLFTYVVLFLPLS